MCEGHRDFHEVEFFEEQEFYEVAAITFLCPVTLFTLTFLTCSTRFASFSNCTLED